MKLSQEQFEKLFKIIVEKHGWHHSPQLGITTGYNGAEDLFKAVVKYITDNKKSHEVYILEDRGYIKVGRSTNWRKRFESHRCSNPRIKYVTHYRGNESLEKEIHRELKDHLIEDCTEWFYEYDGIYEDIKSVADRHNITVNNEVNNIKELFESYPMSIYAYEPREGNKKDCVLVIARNESLADIYVQASNGYKRLVKREISLYDYIISFYNSGNDLPNFYNENIFNYSRD